jgi:hypothetical protein
MRALQGLGPLPGSAGSIQAWQAARPQKTDPVIQCLAASLRAPSLYRIVFTFPRGFSRANDPVADVKVF